MALAICASCGHKVSTTARACPNCNAPPPQSVYCTRCGKSIPDTATACPICGAGRYKKLSESRIEKSQNLSTATEKSPPQNQIRSVDELQRNQSRSTRDRDWLDLAQLDAAQSVAVLIVVLSIGVVFFLVRTIDLSSVGEHVKALFAGPNASDTSSDYNNPPSFISEVKMEHQGDDGLAVWFTLADEGNNETRTSGKVFISISGGFETEDGPFYSPSWIFSETWDLRASDFAKWKFTNELTGATSEKLIWHSRRIRYSELARASLGTTLLQAQVVIKTADGLVLSGKSREPFHL